jgi:hypothetical protein
MKIGVWPGQHADERWNGWALTLYTLVAFADLALARRLFTITDTRRAY